MPKILLFSLLTFISFSVRAQSIPLELKNFPIEIENRNFYISRVIDCRNDSSKLGWSVLNKETKRCFYTFRKSTEYSIDNYLKTNLKSDSAQTPLVLNIISLIITERKKGMAEGRAILSVQFLKEEKGQFGKVYETTTFTESFSEFGKDIYSSHERRIRTVINQSLKNLAESKWAEVKPDYMSAIELRSESQLLDTVSKYLADTVGLFGTKKKEDLALLQLEQIQFKGGIVPKYTLNENKYRTLWAFKKHFKQLSDNEVNKLYSDYKAKFKLSFLAFGIGAALVGIAYSDDTLDEPGIPNLSIAIPGVAFLGCSIPIYIKTNKLARKTTEAYNLAIENK